MSSRTKAALLISASQRNSDDFRALCGVDNDVSEMHGFLSHRAGFQRVQMLRDRPKHDVLLALRNMLGTLQRGDHLLLYFSGHGHYVNNQHLLLCPGATFGTLDLSEEVIPVELLRRMTNKPGLERLLILDCCRDSLYRAPQKGSTAGFKGAQFLKNIGTSEASGEATGSFTVVCGCEDDQVAIEIPDLERGLFSTGLLDVWSGVIDQGRCLPVSDDEVANVAQRMAQLGRELNLPIIPKPWKSGPAVVIWEGEAPPQPRAGRVTIEETPSLRIESIPVGAKIWVEGHEVGTSPLKLELPAGSYRIRAELAECEVWERKMVFDASGDAELRVELKAKPKLVEAFFPMTAPEAQRVQQEAAAALSVPVQQELDMGGGVKARFILIPPGGFMMGSPEMERDRGPDEHQHRVRLTRGFYLGITQVTQRQWEIVMRSNPSYFKSGDLPVEQVSWEDAVEFCETLSAKESKSYRLPTDAEWEYACRAGSTGPYAGNGKLDDMGWYSVNAGSQTHPVGMKQANAWGLHDMQGNVWEWCNDRHAEYDFHYVDGSFCYPPVDDPKGGARGRSRVVRGGEWSLDPQYCRSAFRPWLPPGGPIGLIGFRLALDLP